MECKEQNIYHLHNLRHYSGIRRPPSPMGQALLSFPARITTEPARHLFLKRGPVCLSECIVVHISGCLERSDGANRSGRLSTCHQSHTLHTRTLDFSGATDTLHQRNAVRGKEGLVIGCALWATERVSHIAWPVLFAKRRKYWTVSHRRVTHTAR